MSFTSIPWNLGSWSNDPKSIRIEGNTLIVEAAEGSDYWEKTLYQFQHDNGHALLAPWEDSDGVEVSFKLDSLTELYDQAGIMLWYSPTQWIKAGIEINDGIPHLGAVVTNEYSDWSLSPIPDWAGKMVTLRASRFNDAVILRARTEEHPWRTIRVSRFPFTTGKKAGPFLCAPTRSGFQVAFTRWLSTRTDEDLHIDPPIVDLKD
ncbi:DUF1349 domain-containing protein [Paenibacillus wynnii]|uniref:DUF1349 domain-containing protein n=1 Tax=Paenibacillus wynnii TaxID=268407 RepID=UPI0027913F11|nr:DUF1349 domain-containing protein [Paenibacillus wynnii]MDQ0195064.1 regulation of enolase protein 1 (concanavalin A-like superfamily) [Paenibacillus wynnii]